MTSTTTPLPLGRIVATRGALAALERAQERPANLLRRHQHGDDGDLHPDDHLANLRALRLNQRVLSAYVLSTGDRIWIITEADRSMTTLLAPEEY
jgi:hypothetical protein